MLVFQPSLRALATRMMQLQPECSNWASDSGPFMAEAKHLSEGLDR